MDILAEIWYRSDKKSELLYDGSIDDITNELKAWVERRKANNDASISVAWNMFEVLDIIKAVSDIERVLTATDDQLNNHQRNRDLEKERKKETRLANFLLASLRHRGVEWPQLRRTALTRADAGVCAFLGTVVQGYDSKAELKILKDKARRAQWETEVRRREEVDALELANDHLSRGEIHPVGEIGDRMKQVNLNAVMNSTRQTITDPLDHPDILDLLKRPNAAGKTSLTTGEHSSKIHDAAGPSCSTAMETGEQGQDGVNKPSKAKKKREGRKRAKARAKEAAADTGALVDNHEDDDGDGSGPLDT